MAASWTPGWDDWPAALLEFWTERHLCTLSTLRPDGRPHVVPVGVVVDVEERCAWVITNAASVKARHLAAPGPVAACQVDGGRWATIEGTAVARADPESVARAVERYAARYRQPRPNPTRVALRIEVERLLCSPRLVDRPVD
jgi:PPOX class probable F420-dependent enzyme